MDGGGRLLRSLTAGSAGGALALAGPGAAQGLLAPSFSLKRLSPWTPRRPAVVPARQPLPRFLGIWLTLGFFSAVLATGLSAGGHLDPLTAVHGSPPHAMARLLGFGIDQVTISGLDHLTTAEILDAAGIVPQVSLAFLNAVEVRARLEALPLVQSAAVRKLYPNDLRVALVERKPHALWQNNGELFVIAADGTVIDDTIDHRLTKLPLVVGEGANKRTQDYLALMERAGPLRDRIRAGSLVAGRRWTLKLDNGIDVRLPELGVDAALARLAKLEREQKILDKDVIAIDLRLPDRIVVRLTEEAAAARADALKKKPVRGKGVDT